MDAIFETTPTNADVVDRALSTAREILDLTGPEESGRLGTIRSKALVLLVDLRLLKKGACE